MTDHQFHKAVDVEAHNYAILLKKKCKLRLSSVICIVIFVPLYQICSKTI